MIKKNYLVFFLLFGCIGSWLVEGANQNKIIVPLPDVLNAGSIYSDDKQFYVVHDATIYIYRWDDFRFVKQFGSLGEAPQQFFVYKDNPVRLAIYPDKLLISCLGRVSVYKKDGTFISEIRTDFTTYIFQLGMYYLLMDASPGYPGNEYVSFYLCNNKFEKIKELRRALFPLDLFKKEWRVFAPFVYLRQYKDMAFMTSGYDLEIIGVASSGKTFLNLKHKFEKIRVTSAHIKDFHEYFRTKHHNKAEYEKWRKHFIFPEYFPAIKDFQVADDKIYVQTYRLNDKKQSEFHIFTLQGKSLGSVYLPVIPDSMDSDYPYAFKNNQFLQLVEDVDEEIWYLHITLF